MKRLLCLLAFAAAVFAQDLASALAQLKKDVPGIAPAEIAARLNSLCGAAAAVANCEAWALAEATDLQAQGNASAFAAEIAVLGAVRDLRVRLTGPDSVTAPLLVELGEAYAMAGDVKSAEPLFTRAVELQRSRQLEDAVTAVALNDLAMIRDAQSDYQAEIALHQQALEIRRKVFGERSPITVESLINLADTYESLHDMRQAETLVRRALAILDQVEPSGGRTVAACLLLGDILHTEGHFQSAEPFYQRALALADSLDHDSTDVATAIDNLASLYDDEGLYEKARPLRLRSVHIFEEKLGPDHPYTAAALHNLGTLDYQVGEYDQAKENYQRALAVREKTLPAESTDTAATLDALAQTFEALGDSEKAEPLYRRALAIREAKLGANHPLTGATFNNLGVLYLSLGDYAQAERLLERAASVAENAQPPNPVETASRLGNLAYLYGAEGAYARAEALWKRAIEMRITALGRAHRETAESVLNLAELYGLEKKYALAEPLYTQALAALEKALPSGHPDIGIALNGLASLYLDENEPGKAEPLLARAQSILGADLPDSAYTLLSLGKMNFERGNYAAAEDADARSLAVFKKSAAGDSPDAILVRADDARALWQIGRHAAARDQLIEANREVLRFWSGALIAVEEERRRSLVEKFVQLLPLSLSMAEQLSREDPAGAVRLSAVAILARKGVRSSARQEAFARIQRDHNPEAVALLHRLADNAEQQGRIARAGNDSNPNVRLARLRADESRIEQQLIEKSPAFRAWQAAVEPAQISKALPSGAALIDVIRYPRLDLATGAVRETEYAAVVYPAAAEPKLVWLGAAAAIDRAVAALRSNFENIWNTCLPEDHCGEAQRVLKQGDDFTANLHHTEDDCANLYRLTMAKLRSAIGNRKHLLVSPDGSLAEIPWDILRDGEYLVEQGYRVRYLDSARSVIETHPAQTPRSPAVVIANLDYDGRSKLAAIQEPPVVAEDVERPAGFAGKWLPLHGGDEILRTLDDLSREGKIAPVDKLSPGSEEEVEALRQPLAIFAHTHGFFFSHPGVLSDGLDSGIVLYGANRAAANGARDGWLTAKEAMLLHLEGTQLVALLGCETGLGAETGEGVQGLRHALAVAGARSTLLTLWDVGDLSSARFLKELLVRLASGEKIEDAIAETRLAFASGAVRESGSTAASSRWRHPYFWAAATLSGDGGTVNLR